VIGGGSDAFEEPQSRAPSGSAAHYSIEPLGDLPLPLEPRELSPHVALVLPAYNEQRAIVPTYHSICAVMDSVPVSWSILFVNDGSNDGTLAVLDELYRSDERVSYISLSRNFGHQSALEAGLDHAVGDVMITMDADLQHPPAVLPVLIEGWRQGYDVVHTQKISTRDLGRTRALATRIAYRAIKATASVDFIPQASDFRLLDAAARDAIRAFPERGRLYRGLARWIGLRQAVVPFEANERVAGNSTYGIRRLASLFSKAFFDFSSAPLRLALVLGSSAIALCMGYVAFVLIAYIVGNAVPPGYVSLIFAIVFLSSLNLTLIGVLGVYVSRIYDEVRGRPSYLIGRTRIHSIDVVRTSE
jgi:dolichol-phosphate mannosyltransferase